MSTFKMLDGNSAAVEAMKMARIQCISAYPITPQSTIAEKLSECVANGELDAEYIRVESEHTAMSCAIGAQLTGIRTGTATASVGLALMHEVVGFAAGCRVPIVMPVVNRSIGAPWSLWCDHSDSMAERDSGWLQFYCENVQDVFDSILMAYRIAEHKDVLLPAMVCLDGFFLSHSMQKLEIPSQQEVDEFVGPYTVENLKLDPENPMAICNLTGSSDNEEIRYQQAMGFWNAEKVMDEVFAEFEQRFGRKKSAVEGYCLDDAEAVIICMGSMSGTTKYVVDQLRAEGKKVGMIKVFSFRPFPARKLAEMLRGISKVAVIDRSCGFGAQGGPLWVETKAAVGGDTVIRDYVAGLAGRDVHPGTLRNVFEDIMAATENGFAPNWIDCDKENAMTLREVERYV